MQPFIRIFFLLSALLQLALMPVCADEHGTALISPAGLINDTTNDEAASEFTAVRRPVIDLEQLRVLELDQDGINWRQDWWKYLLILLSGLLCLCLIVYLTKVLFWLFGVLVCLASGLAGGIFLKSLFSPWLPALLPDALTSLVSASMFCHILGGLVGYGAAACLLAFLLRPLKQKRKNG